MVVGMSAAIDPLMIGQVIVTVISTIWNGTNKLPGSLLTLPTAFDMPILSFMQ